MIPINEVMAKVFSQSPIPNNYKSPKAKWKAGRLGPGAMVTIAEENGYKAEILCTPVTDAAKDIRTFEGMETTGLSEVSFSPKVMESCAITSSMDAYAVLLKHWNKSRIGYCEDVLLLLLNKAHFPLGIVRMAEGGHAQVTMEPKGIYQVALVGHAAGIIVAHNHPSGVTKPSTQDITITKVLVSSGQIIGIPLLDHLILTPDSYYSFADEGHI